MIRYIVKRILQVIPVLLGISFITFMMLSLTPGDPAQLMLGAEAGPEQVEALRRDLGLDQPLLTQYFNYIRGIVTQGDFGISYTTRRSVSIELFEKLPYSMQLALWSIIIATVLGVSIGIFSAIRQYTIFDTLSTSLGLVGLSIPNFWMGLMLIIAFAVNLRWLPSSGVITWTGWILPSITIGVTNCARVMRMTRSSMLEVLRQDYITTARAKGLSERIVIYRHALRNAMIPIITLIGLTFGGTMAGSIVTENVFSIPGLGKLMVDSLNRLNYPMVMGAVLLIAVQVCIVNLIIDIVYAFVDPRIRAQYKSSKKNKPAVQEAAVK